MTNSTHFRTGAATAISAVALGVLGVSGDSAQAALCGERDKIQKVLSERYKESTRGLGMVSERGVVELYTSESGSFSILLTTPAGSSCIIATGSHWQELVQTPEGPEA